jgi:hypothetical protein
VIRRKTFARADAACEHDDAFSQDKSR